MVLDFVDDDVVLLVFMRGFVLLVLIVWVLLVLLVGISSMVVMKLEIVKLVVMNMGSYGLKMMRVLFKGMNSIWERSLVDWI